MDELHTESGIRTFVEFKKVWHGHTDEGWQFVSATFTQDDGQELVFKRPKPILTLLSGC